MENSKQKNPKKLQKQNVFQMVQKYLTVLGVTSSNAWNQSNPFKRTILFGFLLLGSFICCILMYVIYDAETFVQYTQSMYVCSFATLIIVSLLILILKAKKLFEFIDNCGSIVNDGESKKKKNQSKFSCHAIEKSILTNEKLFIFSFQTKHWNIWIQRRKSSLKQFNLKKK